MSAVIGVVGLGKLGLPVAVTLAHCGHQVLAYDVNPDRMSLAALSDHELSPHGDGPLIDSLDESLSLQFVDLPKAAAADCVFVVAQTPHEPLYEGITPLPDSRADFGYDALAAAVRSVVEHAAPHTEIGVMSTVMPGTMRSRMLPLAVGRTLVYCPQFVAMGAVARDMLRPEFTLIGQEGDGGSMIRHVLSGLGDAPTFQVSYETAELAKVLYNTFVSAKVAVANVAQRMADEVGASAAGVFSILRASDRRLISDAYLGPGMGDGGPCHPRDNIALSWLAREVGMGADLFSAIMQTRQGYVEWLADRFTQLGEGLPLVILGTAFKPGVDIRTGSSAVLMANLLRLRQVDVTIVDGPAEAACLDTSRPAAYFLGCPEPTFVDARFCAGSVVVDPWHVAPSAPGVRVLWIGEP